MASALVRAAPRVTASLYPLRPGFRPEDEQGSASTIRSAVDQVFLGRPESLADADFEPRQEC